MVVALLDAAQVERIPSLVADQKSEAIDVEGARAGEIADAKLDVARARWRTADRKPDRGSACSGAVDGGCADF